MALRSDRMCPVFSTHTATRRTAQKREEVGAFYLLVRSLTPPEFGLTNAKGLVLSCKSFFVWKWTHLHDQSGQKVLSPFMH